MAKRLRSAIACGPEGSADSGLVCVELSIQQTNAQNFRGYGILSGCGIAVPRAPFESIQLQQFSKGV
jgi:hypothetical protein